MKRQSQVPFFLPIQLLSQENQFWIKWKKADYKVFLSPFFDDDFDNHKNDYADAQAFTPLSLLLNQIVNNNLTMMIFHSSRCGSTLLSQMLNSSGQFHCVSEPEFINELLKNSFLKEEFRWRSVRQALLFYGNKAFHQHQYFCAKFPSWNVLYYKDLQKLFPLTPKIFIYRDPLETLASIVNKPSEWLQRENYFPTDFTDFPQIHEKSSEFNIKRCLEILGIFYRRGILMAQQGNLLINYDEFPDVVQNRILPYLGIKIPKVALLKMKQRSMFYSKADQVTEIFSSDQLKKRQQIQKTWINLDHAITRPFYENLENMRTNQMSKLI